MSTGFAAWLSDSDLHVNEMFLDVEFAFEGHEGEGIGGILNLYFLCHQIEHILHVYEALLYYPASKATQV